MTTATADPVLIPRRHARQAQALAAHRLDFGDAPEVIMALIRWECESGRWRHLGEREHETIVATAQRVVAGRAEA